MGQIILVVIVDMMINIFHIIFG